MKQIGTFLTALMIAGSATAELTGEDFLMCSKAPPADKSNCDAYILGYITGANYLDSYNESDKRLFCSQPRISTKEAIDSFYQYLEDNPELRDKKANFLLFVHTLKKYMPCK